MSGRFHPARLDGRSDMQVIYDLVSGAAPNALFEHELLEEALAEGVTETITPARRNAAARRANQRLLQFERRALAAVRGVGYRVLQASEHLPSARIRQERATVQMSRGLDLLRQVHWDEMTADERRAHEAQLLISSALHQGLLASAQRHADHEAAIDAIKSRLDRLEGDPMGEG